MQNLVEQFIRQFGKDGDIRSYFAPGRVNLIGEHTDYNGGHVFPCALTMGTYCAARKRTDSKICMYSVNYCESGIIESDINCLSPLKNNLWTMYPEGVIWSFGKFSREITNGFDILFYGNIPNGAGLSSSASIEVVTAVMLKDMYNYSDLTMVGVAKLAQYAENNYCGMNCGIMDQFTIAMGKKDCAILLDTDTLEYQYAPIELKDYRIIITNSNVKHSLVGSKYNERRSECEQALQILQKYADISSLGALTIEEFEKICNGIYDETIRKRAKHAVYENQRTIQAAQALNNNDIERLGQLMNESHISLRDDYEVSCEEIDVLVESAWNVKGVAGSRITGGGFGGCTVSIVNKDSVEEFKRVVTENYREKAGKEAVFYEVAIGDGAGFLK